MIALVTGGSRGIGAATARALARHGARVVLTSRSLADAEQAAAALERDGGEAIGLALDATVDGAVEGFAASVLEAIERRWGAHALDALVVNAGVGIFEPFGDIQASSIDAMLALNVRAPLLLAQAFAPSMPTGAGIVLVSSSLSRHTSVATAPYAASKAAVDVLARSLALELGPAGVRVNAIAPGPTATDFNGGAMRDDPAMRDALAGQTALGRVGEPDEIADAIVATLGPGMRWVTGQRIEVSGGVLL